MDQNNWFMVWLSHIWSLIKNNSGVTYVWTTLTGFFSVMSLQDYAFVLGAIISAIYTIKTYRANKMEKTVRAQEERKRTTEIQKQTKIIEEYLSRNSASTPPEAMQILSSAVKKADQYTNANLGDANVGDANEQTN